MQVFFNSGFGKGTILYKIIIIITVLSKSTFCSTFECFVILHKSTSVVVFRAAPGAPREGGVVGGGRTREDGAWGEWILSLLLKVRHCPPRHQMSFS